MLVHGSCAAEGNEGVLILGPSGAGKSDLLLRLLRAGWQLVADDQVEISADGSSLRAAAPPALHGRMEVRGLGLFQDLPAALSAPLRLVIELVARTDVPRLPLPARWPALHTSLPLVRLHAFDGSTPAKASMALAAATQRLRQTAGAFEAA